MPTLPVLSSTDGEILFGFASSRREARAVARRWLRQWPGRRAVGPASIATHAPTDISADYDGYRFIGRPVYIVMPV